MLNTREDNGLMLTDPDPETPEQALMHRVEAVDRQTGKRVVLWHEDITVARAYFSAMSEKGLRVSLTNPRPDGSARPYMGGH